MIEDIVQPVRRVDAVAKASGTARYIADMEFPNMRFGRLIRSERSRARIVSIQVPDLPEDYHLITYKDIPSGGVNRIRMISDDWPVFAEEEVRFIGETIGLLVGPDRNTLKQLEKAIRITYEDLAPILTIDEALEQDSIAIAGDRNLFADYEVEKGSVESGFEHAERVVEDLLETGYQEHVYMETQGMVGHMEGDDYILTASCQCPFYMRKAVSAVLATDVEHIIVRQAVTGGAFGGKEHFPDVIAAPLVVAVHVIRKPIQIIFERSEDISFTAKRHPSRIKYRTGIDAAGRITAMDVDILINAGAYLSCSNIVLQRALFSSNSVYEIPNVRVRARSVATNTFPSDAFRGFGAPQGLFACEMHMTHLARAVGRDAVDFKRAHLIVTGGKTITQGTIRDKVLLPEMLDRILELSHYREITSEDDIGSGHAVGIACYNHGAGFTGNGEQDIIKARLRIRKREDDTVELFLSNVEMGQGLQTTFSKVAAKCLGIPMTQVRMHNPDTSKDPDSGPTVASRSMMVVGRLVERAALELKERWDEGPQVDVEVRYQHPEGIHWDQESLQGDAYPAYGWGVCAIEVEVDPVTYEVATKGIWAIHDVGMPIDETIVQGQVHGGIIQALGYGSLEHLVLKDGRFYQHTMADYSIPTSMDFPPIHSELVMNPYEYGPFGAKGIGELVFDGAAAAYADAVQRAIGKDLRKIPVTPEYIMEVMKHG